MDSSNNIVNAACTLATQLDIKITSSVLKKSIEQNPYYPSLLSLSSVFNRFNVPNQSFELTFEQFRELEAPFVTFWNKEFLVVTSKSENSVTYIDANWKTITMSTEDFGKSRNVVFVAEPDRNSGDPEYDSVCKKERADKIKRLSILSLSALVGTLLLFQFYTYDIQSLDSLTFAQTTLLIAGKLTGLCTTVLLLIYQIDKSNVLVKNICSAGKQTNCDVILNSKVNGIWGMTWSEIGLVYFSSTMLFLIYPGIELELKKPFLAITAMATSPYILFSLYYQWRVIKTWCPLCLVVQVALTVDLIWAIWSQPLSNGNYPKLGTDPQVVIALILILLGPAILLFVIKPILLNAKKVNEFEILYKRLLYNPEIFASALQRQQTAPEGWANIGLTLGNPNSDNTIIKVCNPYCGPCAKMHSALEEITLNTNCNIKVIFTATNEVKNRGGLVARHLLAIASQGNPAQFKKAMDDWYLTESKDYQTFAMKYPMNGEIENQREKLDKMRIWCNEAAITYTPTLFINGKLLPETYSIEELKHILTMNKNKGLLKTL
jgi:uncharacterized membrane protein